MAVMLLLMADGVVWSISQLTTTDHNGTPRRYLQSRN